MKTIEDGEPLGSHETGPEPREDAGAGSGAIDEAVARVFRGMNDPLLEEIADAARACLRERARRNELL